MSGPVLIGSLFSGIGGLELGIESAFAAARIPARVAWQVEQDAYCRAVLAKHWPGTDRSVTDVRAVGLSVLPSVDVLVGGPPCQDISGAGKQEGLSGERSGLLFQYLRIVRELRPATCVAENVYGGQWRAWLDAVRCGLEGAGYTVRAGKLRAADVGAPHKRSRIFVVAHADGGREPQPEGRERHERGLARHGGQALGHADGAGRQRSATGAKCTGGRVSRGASDGRRVVEFEPRVVRAVHGLPGGVDGHRWPTGRGEAQSAWEPPRTIEGRQAHRRARIRALGNSVVPQCAEVVGRELVVEAFR